jgi:hypothetical protein
VMFDAACLKNLLMRRVKFVCVSRTDAKADDRSNVSQNRLEDRRILRSSYPQSRAY